MKAFLHEGEGHYMGSKVVVIAPDKVDAEKQIRKALDKAGLPKVKIKITKEVDTAESALVFIDNGDY